MDPEPSIFHSSDHLFLCVPTAILTAENYCSAGATDKNLRHRRHVTSFLVLLAHSRQPQTVVGGSPLKPVSFLRL